MRLSRLLVVVLGLASCREKDSVSQQQQEALHGEIDQAKHDLEAQRQQADRQIAGAMHQAQQTQTKIADQGATVDKLNKQFADLRKRTDDATTALANAKTDAERAAASAKLQQLRTEHDDLTRQLQAAAAANP